LSKAGIKNIFSAIKQIQATHDLNWSANFPFEITIANFFTNSTISRAIKKHWNFLLGPNFKHATHEQLIGALERYVDDEEETDGGREFSSTFVPNPFRPRVSTWGIEHICGQNIKKDEIAYISSSATQYLDEKIRRYKAFVVPACRDSELENPWHKSVAAAIQDNIPVYRLPLEKYVKSVGWSSDISLVHTSDVIRHVYYEQSSWESATRKCYTEYIKTSEPEFEPEDAKTKMIKADRKWRIRLLKRMSDALFSSQKTYFSRLEIPPAIKSKRSFSRRYSRDERNMKRTAIANEN